MRVVDLSHLTWPNMNDSARPVRIRDGCGLSLGMGANRTRIRELADSQPILLIRTNSQFARADLRVGESRNGKK